MKPKISELRTIIANKITQKNNDISELSTGTDNTQVQDLYQKANIELDTLQAVAQYLSGQGTMGLDLI